MHVLKEFSKVFKLENGIPIYITTLAMIIVAALVFNYMPPCSILLNVAAQSSSENLLGNVY